MQTPLSYPIATRLGHCRAGTRYPNLRLLNPTSRRLRRMSSILTIGKKRGSIPTVIMGKTRCYVKLVAFLRNSNHFLTMIQTWMSLNLKRDGGTCCVAVEKTDRGKRSLPSPSRQLVSFSQCMTMPPRCIPGSWVSATIFSLPLETKLGFLPGETNKLEPHCLQILL